MRGNPGLPAAASLLLLLLSTSTCATPISGSSSSSSSGGGGGDTQSTLHPPLEGAAGQDSKQQQQQHHHYLLPGGSTSGSGSGSARPHLHGRFLHITDIHPDSHYKVHSSTEERDACHRGDGAAGTYGAETSDCDTPFSLVNETFQWIETHLKDQIDFVIWTGDSARHDSDEKIPRKQDEVLDSNKRIVQKFEEVFGDTSNPHGPLSIPVIPTFGNNDILPHNILQAGPNKWLKTYADIWGRFIPEEQRHGFERGGWFYVEVIPRKLAVFSLNTLYFFNNNAAVDGCALRSEPGFEHMEWLRIQLQFMRERGMKAILTGHVPPARTESKQLWDETCWQKYTLWLRQFRDVIVGGLYGHMNIDHFVLHDTKDIDIQAISGTPAEGAFVRSPLEDELSTESASDYLEELRDDWSALPIPSSALKKLDSEDLDDLEGDERSDEVVLSGKKKHKGKKKKGKKGKKDPFKKIGGRWGERFQVTTVGPSVVPNFFPTLRVMEYNISGLDLSATWANPPSSEGDQQIDWMDEELPVPETLEQDSILQPVDENDEDDSSDEETISKKKKKHRKHKKPKTPDLTVPSPPSKDSPPGPAYSPQSLTLLGYTQYYANLTHINNDRPVDPDDEDVEDKDADTVDADRWREGKHKGKRPKDGTPNPNPFEYQIEYDTFTDPIYRLKDLTVSSYLRLAHRIGQYDPDKGDRIDEDPESGDEDGDDTDEDHSLDEESSIEHELEPATETKPDGKKDGENGKNGKKHKKKKKKKHHKKKDEKNKVWLRFVQRAFVGTLNEANLPAVEVPPVGGILLPAPAPAPAPAPVLVGGAAEAHDGEL